MNIYFLETDSGTKQPNYSKYGKNSRVHAHNLYTHLYSYLYLQQTIQTFILYIYTVQHLVWPIKRLCDDSLCDRNFYILCQYSTRIKCDDTILNEFVFSCVVAHHYIFSVLSFFHILLLSLFTYKQCGIALNV